METGNQGRRRSRFVRFVLARPARPRLGHFGRAVLGASTKKGRCLRTTANTAAVTEARPRKRLACPRTPPRPHESLRRRSRPPRARRLCCGGLVRPGRRLARGGARVLCRTIDSTNRLYTDEPALCLAGSARRTCCCFLAWAVLLALATRLSPRPGGLDQPTTDLRPCRPAGAHGGGPTDLHRRPG